MLTDRSIAAICHPMSTNTMTANSDLPHATRKEWVGVVVLSIACMLYSMDLSVLFLAIPSITAELKASPTQLLWMNDIYGFMVAGFLVTMGTLGDLIGRRKILLWGAAAFGLASVFCAFAPNATMLVIGRALLGIAGATIAPSTMSLIFAMFHREDERNRAIGIWGTAFAVGGTIGPVVGGVLLNWFHWGSVFLINVPIMAALLILGPRLLPEYKSDEPHARLDLASVALSLAAVLPFIYGLKHVAAYGVDYQVVVGLAVGIFFGWQFWQRQHSIAHPLVDFELFKSSRFNLALTANLAGIFFIFAIFMFQNQFLQLVLGMKPLEAGLWSVAPSIVFCAMSLYSYKVTNVIGLEKSVIWGLGIYAVGGALMAWAAYTQSLYGILGSSMVMAIGFVPVILTTTTLIVSAAPPERAGSASAISETSAEFGGALGVALLGSLATWVYRNSLAAADAPAAAKATLNDAVISAGSASPAWLTTAKTAFANGYAINCVLAALGMAVLTVVAQRVLRAQS
jgi:MFS transporter, DHA2 family, multidrug resistance protein